MDLFFKVQWFLDTLGVVAERPLISRKSVGEPRKPPGVPDRDTPGVLVALFFPSSEESVNRTNVVFLSGPPNGIIGRRSITRSRED